MLFFYISTKLIFLFAYFYVYFFFTWTALPLTESWAVVKSWNNHPQPCRCMGECYQTLLMFRLQMTETSNPKHGCAVETQASGRCQPVGLLTDDTPDSAFLLSPPCLVTFRLRRNPPNPPTSPQNMEGNHGNTEPDYSPHTVIEYVTNTLRITLRNQIKNELFIRTWYAGLIGQNTPTI